MPKGTRGTGMIRMDWRPARRDTALWPQLALALLLALGLLGGGLALAPAARAATLTFNYTGGEQTWIVPAGVTSVTVDVYGAQGGGGFSPGLGGRATVT